MSKVKKFAVYAACLCIVLGVIVSLAAFALAGFHPMQLNTERYKTEVFEITEPFDSIAVTSNGCAVRFARSTDGSCSVRCVTSEIITNEVEVRDNTLTVRQTDDSRFPIRFQIMMFTAESPAITVYLPEREYARLTVKTGAEKISIPADFTFDDVRLHSSSGSIDFAAQTQSALEASATSGRIALKNAGGAVTLKTTSGDITLDGVNARTLTATATSGQIKADGITVEDAAEFGTTSGSLRLSDLRAGILQLSATSGSITVQSGYADEVMNIECTSGNVRLTDSDAAELSIKTTSGSVRASLLSPKDFSVRSTSGSISVPPDERGAGRCDITTSSGSINVTVK